MKNVLFTCFASILFSLLTNSTYSQGLNRTATPGYSDEEFISSSDPIIIVKDSIATIPAGIKKAVKSFTRDYKNVPKVKWLTLKNGYSVVYFTVDGIKTRLVYNKKGYCENMIRYYFEDKLSPEIRHLVKSTYYDFSIFLVTEVHLGDAISYLVKIQDKTSWKTIKVVEGEMEIMEEYAKR